ncbi:solute carrier family 23 protein [Lactobacillus kefiranofaciens]|uniref:Solute carrier family 23 protein n=1 Tax=Lactobacillus kefiranofaciens TaxID=267818 RepID=A0AAX3UHX0_9LACO|nr:solute carrier family 23 protein [Lactobacillus kefiranofaciens]AEG40764.1 Uracil permease [Lactobacillus kefiranofaciens subsp. kefiranofaciens]KRL24872.1 Uracil permease [Lactobacillus kefiranofaciens subsp. kefirgranum DSM 10550 = JCM 8572]KRM22802.1 Uracil permease [Lactobacillus kefiranofaciens subsp. kefiranofaciens DSM 5016 = JCM 6985]MCJ2171805.1 NCS2 family nucleobase:cation symporter [Lactobacillus kefiranofaciens]MCP9330858.1 uracil permease [Lactobacillus kefiranofaciens]
MSKKENFRNPDAILDVYEKPEFGQGVLLSLQHMFAMFGSTVLVPILIGINPSIALLSSGIGTLVHMILTHFKIPAYLGSSFAFVATMQALMKADGYPAVAQGAIASGLVYVIVALIIAKVGSGWVNKVLPPIVVGPIIIVIGLSLATTAANDAMMNNQKYDLTYFGVAIFTLVMTLVFQMCFKGFTSLVSIMLGIICGYVLACFLGIVDFSGVENAAWFSIPSLDVMGISYHFKWYPAAILAMAPITFVTMTEHMGHIMVLNSLTKRNFFKNPGLHRTMMGDGISTIIAGFIGGPPTTSYGENIGVLAMTKVHSVWVLAGAAVCAIIFSFVGKLAALIESIPMPVIGGISFLLFGTIASNGLKILVDDKVDFGEKRNMLIASVILVIGIGGAYLQLGNFQLTSVALSTIIGMILNWVLPKKAASEKALEEKNKQKQDGKIYQ